MKNKYEVRGDVTAIFAVRRNETIEILIDTDDLHLANQYPNSWMIRGDNYVRGAVRCKNDKKTIYYLHRVIMKPEGRLVIDHINGDPLDNRRSNLRVCTTAENVQNIKRPQRNSTSGVLGVTWHDRLKKWEAKICVNGKKLPFGYFDSKEDAEKAVQKGRAKYMSYSSEALQGIDTTGVELYMPKKQKKPSGVKGIYWDCVKSKWYVTKNINGSRKFFGYYEQLQYAINRLNELNTL